MHPLSSHLSYWEAQHLTGDYDYTILGMGIVGLSTAIELMEIDPSLKIRVIDQKVLPVGASTRNAGFACFGSVSEISDDISQHGLDVASQLVAMRWQGLQRLRSRVMAEEMKYKNQPGIEVFGSAEEAEQYRALIPEYNGLVSSISGEIDCFSFSKEGVLGPEISNRLEGSVNPQMMMARLELIARTHGVVFVQGLAVTSIDRDRQQLETAFGTLGYSHLVVCTNGFTSQLLPELDLQPARNQVLVTSPIDGFSLQGCYHMDRGYVYFREIEGRLLIGGGRHLDVHRETTTDFGTTTVIQDFLKATIRHRILGHDDYEIDHSWSGILGVGSSKVPIVKNIKSNLTVAVRMGGMGVAIGSYIGQLTAAILTDTDNSARRLFVIE